MASVSDSPRKLYIFRKSLANHRLTRRQLLELPKGVRSSVPMTKYERGSHSRHGVSCRLLPKQVGSVVVYPLVVAKAPSRSVGCVRRVLTGDVVAGHSAPKKPGLRCFSGNLHKELTILNVVVKNVEAEAAGSLRKKSCSHLRADGAHVRFRADDDDSRLSRNQKPTEEPKGAVEVHGSYFDHQIVREVRNKWEASAVERRMTARVCSIPWLHGHLRNRPLAHPASVARAKRAQNYIQDAIRCWTRAGVPKM